MSPEQARGEVLDARSDIYSLGCLMYETLSGDTPHTGGNSLEIMYKHMNDVPAPLSTSANKIPQRLEKIIFKTLAKSPSERYQTMSALHKELAAFSKEQKFGVLGTIKDKVELIWLKRRPKTRHERAIALMCVLLFLLTTGVSAWAGRLYLNAVNSGSYNKELVWQDPDLVMHVNNDPQPQVHQRWRNAPRKRRLAR